MRHAPAAWRGGGGGCSLRVHARRGAGAHGTQAARARPGDRRRHRAPGTTLAGTFLVCATLTGAQAMATGARHAALYASTEAIETRAVHAGRSSGDLCHPLPFVPEFFRGEFKSPIADMKNSVKDRANEQLTSYAGTRILTCSVDTSENYVVGIQK